uniref:Methyltransferase-like protein 23 n=1 Tax=Anthurium amnicola TaxID=1678845 RepID=A0A1D1YHX3_9ARAE
MDTALFSPSCLFRCSDDDEEEEDAGEGGPASLTQEQKLGQEPTTFVDRRHAFPGGMELLIREFSFHQLNANLLWPGTFAFSEWLLQCHTCFEGQHILELGSGTGALAIFLRKLFGVNITTSDFDDKEIEENIAHNCRANGLAALPHIRHTWGDPFPVCNPQWEIIIASDILLYVKQYPNLVKTLCFLLKFYNPKGNIAGLRDSQTGGTITVSGKCIHLQWPVFLMSWRRRIGKEEEALFFNGCADAGLVVEHLGSRVYCISLRGS